MQLSKTVEKMSEQQEQQRKSSSKESKRLNLIPEKKISAIFNQNGQNALENSSNLNTIIANDNNLVNKPAALHDKTDIFRKRSKNNEDPQLKQYKQTLINNPMQEKEKLLNFDKKESFQSFLNLGMENKLRNLEADEKRELSNDMNKTSTMSQFFEAHIEKEIKTNNLKKNEKKTIGENGESKKKKSFKKQQMIRNPSNTVSLQNPQHAILNFDHLNINRNIDLSNSEMNKYFNEKNNEKNKNFINFKKKSLIHQAETREKKTINIKTSANISAVNTLEKQEKAKVLPISTTENRNIKDNTNNILIEQQRIKTKTSQIAPSSNILVNF